MAGAAGVDAGVEVLVGEAREETGIGYWYCSRPLECSRLIGMGWGVLVRAYVRVFVGGQRISWEC